MRGPDRARKVVIIPDAHSDPAYSNERFDWLGKFIAAEKPDVVVSIGDFSSMQSLSDHDKGSIIFEGRRYQADCETNRDAIKRTMAPVTHGPEWYITLGNHENYIRRYASRATELDGLMTVGDLGFGEAGWHVVPFLSRLEIGGMLFSHYYASGVSGRPLGGVNQAATMIRDLHQSCVAGHSHIKDYARRTRPDGKPIHALVVGCYVAPEHHEGWSSATEHMWWKGCVVLEDVRDGDFGEMRWVSQERMRELCGAVQSAAVSASNGHVSKVDACNFTGCEDCYPQQSAGGLDYDDVADTQIGAPVVPVPMSRRAFAEQAGVPESTLRDWERREGKPWWEWRRESA